MKILLGVILSIVIISGSITAYAQNDQIPAWVKGIAVFWGEGKITDEEYINAMEFLIESGIIKVNYTIESVIDPKPVVVEPPPADDGPICGTGTELVNGICQVEEPEPVEESIEEIELLEKKYHENGELETEKQYDVNGNREWKSRITRMVH